MVKLRVMWYSYHLETFAIFFGDIVLRQGLRLKETLISSRC